MNRTWRVLLRAALTSDCSDQKTLPVSPMSLDPTVRVNEEQEFFILHPFILAHGGLR